MIQMCPGSSSLVERTIIHVDADAFFASVEQRDHPELRGKPVIVGSDPRSRGVVATCSYEARAFGVRSAMPSFQAYRLCPQAVFVKPRMKKYQEASAAMFEIFDRHSPIVEKLSIDEAFLDVTGSDGRKVASDIRDEVRSDIGITVTVGISYCKYLAKIASDLAKPDGLMTINSENAYDFLSDLPVSRLPGIGPKTQSRLSSMGISRVGVMRDMPEDWFAQVFGKRGTRVFELCNGIDNDPVVPHEDAKSISEETTFPQDIADKGDLKPYLADLCQNVSFRLRKSGLKCKTIGIKVRFSEFSTITREKSVQVPVSSDADLFNLAMTLLDSVSMSKAVRLLGVCAKGLIREEELNPTLFPTQTSAWDDVSKSQDELRIKYGKPVLFLGASLKTKDPDAQPEKKHPSS